VESYDRKFGRITARSIDFAKAGRVQSRSAFSFFCPGLVETALDHRVTDENRGVPLSRRWNPG